MIVRVSDVIVVCLLNKATNTKSWLTYWNFKRVIFCDTVMCNRLVTYIFVEIDEIKIVDYVFYDLSK